MRGGQKTLLPYGGVVSHLFVRRGCAGRDFTMGLEKVATGSANGEGGLGYPYYKLGTRGLRRVKNHKNIVKVYKARKKGGEKKLSTPFVARGTNRPLKSPACRNTKKGAAT